MDNFKNALDKIDSARGSIVAALDSLREEVKNGNIDSSQNAELREIASKLASLHALLYSKFFK